MLSIFSYLRIDDIGEMIISNLIGGLGNQMFQYAAGRALSLARCVPLRIDVSRFAYYSVHQWVSLDKIFNCEIDVATPQEIRHILGWRSSSQLIRILSHKNMGPFRPKSLILEPHAHYWPGIVNVPLDCYIAGYWQSEKYFVKADFEIRSDFLFKQSLAGQNAEIAAQIKASNSVSLHIRRGDYAQSPKARAIHGLCSLEYYRAAVQYIAARVDKPFFFIFSDDVAWAKGNLKINFPCRFINHNHGVDSHNDMNLMSLCRHNIIANSTFSWWGAWLNANHGKIVVAPKAWFASTNFLPDHEQFMNDLISNTWVRL